MIIIQAKHPFHQKIHYEFYFNDININEHSISTISLAKDVDIYRECVVIEQKQLELRGNKAAISVSIPLKPPFDKYIHTTIPGPFNLDRTLIRITIDSVEIWFKWIAHLKHKYGIYIPPSKSDLMQFLQEEPVC